MNIFKEVKRLRTTIKNMQDTLDLKCRQIDEISTIAKINSENFRNLKFKTENPIGYVTPEDGWWDGDTHIYDDVYTYYYVMVDDCLIKHRYMLFNSIELYYGDDFEIIIIEDDAVIIKNKVTKETYLIDKTKKNSVVKLPYGFDICKNNGTESL